MREEYVGVIDKEIAYHKSIYLKSTVSTDYKDGFIAGLEHIRQIYIQVRAAELYPDLAVKGGVDALRIPLES